MKQIGIQHVDLFFYCILRQILKEVHKFARNAIDVAFISDDQLTALIETLS